VGRVVAGSGMRAARVGRRIAIGSGGMGGRPGTGGLGQKTPLTASTQIVASHKVKGTAIASQVLTRVSCETPVRSSPSHKPHRVTTWTAIRTTPILLNAAPSSGTRQTRANQAATSAATAANLVSATPCGRAERSQPKATMMLLREGQLILES